MSFRDGTGILGYLRRVAPAGDGGGPSDGDLLDRFVGRADGAALDALVRRHAPMVWGVCVRVLGREQDAEDAFQATFLVLVRRAAAVRDRALVGNWLYGVARQTALKVRSNRSRRHLRERQGVALDEQSSAAAAGESRPGLAGVLDEEIARLSSRFRAVVVLCDIEGKTRTEAARELGVAEGTVASRLARARAALGRRLLRRGLGVGAAAYGAACAGAAVPPALVRATVRAGGEFAAGRTGVISGVVLSSTEGVLRAMFLHKLKVAAAVVVAVAGVAASGWGVAVAGGRPATPPAAAACDPPAAPPTVAELIKAKDFWTTTGRIGGRTWTEAEAKEVRRLAAESKDPVVRLRAHKVAVDLDGRGTIRVADEGVAVRGFEYAEAHLDKAAVKRVCLDGPFKNYFVMVHNKTKRVVLLLETLEPNTGGLNLEWDADKKKIVGMEPWGWVAGE